MLKEKKRRNKERRRRRRLEKEFGRDLVNKETLVFPFLGYFSLIFPLIFQLQPATVTNKESLVIASIEQGRFSISRFLSFPQLCPFSVFWGNKKRCLFCFFLFVFQLGFHFHRSFCDGKSLKFCWKNGGFFNFFFLKPM